MFAFREINELAKSSGREIGNKIKAFENAIKGVEVNEASSPIKNKMEGLEREKVVEKELLEEYPPGERYTVISEAYLCNEKGEIVKDPISGEARRIDFVVTKGSRVVDSVEVTSMTADKVKQSEKEGRIRESGGNYVKYDGTLYEFSSRVTTRIERRA